MDYDHDVSPTKTGKTTQTAIRIDDELFARIDALVGKLSPAGMQLPRSEVIRAALLRGVESLEAEHAEVEAIVAREHEQSRMLTDSYAGPRVRAAGVPGMTYEVDPTSHAITLRTPDRVLTVSDPGDLLDALEKWPGSRRTGGVADAARKAAEKTKKTQKK